MYLKSRIVRNHTSDGDNKDFYSNFQDYKTEREIKASSSSKESSFTDSDLSGEERSKKRIKHHDSDKNLKKALKQNHQKNSDGLAGEMINEAVTMPGIINGYTTYNEQGAYGHQQVLGHENGYSIKNILNFAAQQSMNPTQACSIGIKRKRWVNFEIISF